MSDKLPPHITMTPVASSNIGRAGYDPQANHLYVDFGKPDKAPSIYRYDDFTAAHMADFDAAPSKGQHFQTQIKGHFNFTKVEP